MEDEEILKLIKNGDTNAFSEIIYKYHRNLLNFIYGLVGDESIVEDIGQEVFISAYKSIEEFDLSRRTPFSAWLFTIARNRCASVYRKKKRHSVVSIHIIQDLPDKEMLVDTLFDRKERLKIIAVALQQVPEPFRMTLMENIKGKSLEEIACSSNVAIGTVKSRLSRAKEHLKVILGLSRKELKENIL